ncbi:MULTISPECIES: SPFH domain-containing protein [Pseudomonas]|uniref:Paraslipin n=1 Tax=Pseudomonas flavocrustae TaxID=2991719 RepID=A0ABT6ILZ2_9PSED|nr:MULTISPECIES: stomatin-like protein [unclassified Pseudomonas]MBB2898980.1 regulator of protease activity HflC (stomatin/prohibitin superfamily) [Pseudomonas sp. AS2.8]MDH4765487.1 paraslipin [Pseudomonas sp. CBMAI 2609]
MSVSLIVALLLLVFIVVTVAKGVRLVPQGQEWIVERLGKYRTTLKPGLNFLIPYMDQVSYRLSTKDLILDVQQQEVITRDNAVILANALCFAKIVDPAKAAYGVEDYAQAITSLAMTSLRAIIGEMELDQALSSRDEIKARLRVSMAEQTVDWGITVKAVEVQELKPTPSMQAAMEMQAAAERERKAVVTRAEGAKQAAILEADARLEAAKRDGVAQVTLAQASAAALSKISEAVGSEPTPVLYLLGERYINAMEKLATSDNAKTVVLPADIQQTLRGLLGTKS